MKIVFFGLTITSAWGNGHATTYRSLLKALAQRGHTLTFVEKDQEWYRNNRDMPQPTYCTLHLYESWETEHGQLLTAAADADVIVIGSYFPDTVVLTCALLEVNHAPLLFYDIDTPVTLAQLRDGVSAAYMHAGLIPHFAAYLSFTGGSALLELEQRFGARQALPFYCSVDETAYRPTDRVDEFACNLSYLGTYAADRQGKLMRLLNLPAHLLPQQEFLVAGALYPELARWSDNVRRVTHVAPPMHPAFYSSSRFTLNLTRADMVAAGYSPSVRLFEASACGACILSDDWLGLEDFLTPGQEILLPRDEHDVADILLHLSEADRLRTGQRARERILASHTSTHRAQQFEEIVSALRPAGRATAPACPDIDPAVPLPAQPVSTRL